MTPWLIDLLYATCFSGLVYSVLRTLRAGVESYTSEYTDVTVQQFEDIFLFIPAERLIELARTAAITTFAVVFVLTANLSDSAGLARGVLLGAAAAVAVLLSPRLVVRILRARRRERFDLQLVDSLMTMSNALKAGFSIRQAFESVVNEGENPIAQEFGMFLHQVRVGVAFDQALSNLEQRVASEDLTLTVLAIETARQTGGNLTEVFERIAATIRERIRINARIRTLTAQGRMQGVILVCVPFILGMMMLVTDPAMMTAFIFSLPGMGLLAIVAVLLVLGASVIRKIVNIDV